MSVESMHARMVDELGYDPDSDDRVRRLPLAEIGFVAPGELLAARDGAHAVAVARLASGRLVVVDDACPHDGGRISDGYVEGERLVCARHGWQLEPCGGVCVRARAR
jgi:phenylpropionate dioxygenase-like ring-hydroxylating dioxygenase large terminal subunit